MKSELIRIQRIEVGVLSLTKSTGKELASNNLAVNWA